MAVMYATVIFFAGLVARGRQRSYITHVAVKNKIKDNLTGHRNDFGLVFIGARIPATLKERLDQVCRKVGMTKQAVIAYGLTKAIPLLTRRHPQSGK